MIAVLAVDMIIEQLNNNRVKNSVVVHIDERLNTHHRQHVESNIEQVDGVTHAYFNETRHHLMIVGYDPQQTNSGEILASVKQQQLSAQLI